MRSFYKKILIYLVVFSFSLSAQTVENETETNTDKPKKSPTSLGSRLKVLKVAGEFIQKENTITTHEPVLVRMVFI